VRCYTDSGAIRFLNSDGSVVGELQAPGHVSAVTSLFGYLAVSEHLLLSRPDKITWLLRQPGVEASVLADDRFWPLRLQEVGGQTAIVLSASTNLSLTVQAFANRTGLKRISAGSLIKRLYVIPLISRSDAVAGKQFSVGVSRLRGHLPAETRLSN
jgi:hypothetical protein